MSQDEALALLRTFGPLQAKELAIGLGLNPKTNAQGNVLRRLKRWGLVRFIEGISLPGGNGGRPVYWEAI